MACLGILIFLSILLIGRSVGDTVDDARPINCVRPLPMERRLFCEGVPTSMVTERLVFANICQ